MSITLLDKTRKIGKLLRNGGSMRVDLCGLCDEVSELLSSNVYVTGSSGEALAASGNYVNQSFEKSLNIVPGTEIDEALLARLSGIFSTKENVNPQALGYERVSSNVCGIVAPLSIAGKRLGTMLFFRNHDPYDIDDVILAEYAGTLAALELGRILDEGEEEERQKQKAVRSALGSLSTSEMEAALAVFSELGEGGGMLVTSAVAAKYNITRSVIINALSKLESAGIADVRSAGAKGTKIKIKNDLIFAEVSRYNADI